MFKVANPCKNAQVPYEKLKTTCGDILALCLWILIFDDVLESC
jgi:hypothetical protein